MEVHFQTCTFFYLSKGVEPVLKYRRWIFLPPLPNSVGHLLPFPPRFWSFPWHTFGSHQHKTLWLKRNCCSMISRCDCDDKKVTMFPAALEPITVAVAGNTSSGLQCVIQKKYITHTIVLHLSCLNPRWRSVDKTLNSFSFIPVFWCLALFL